MKLDFARVQVTPTSISYIGDSAEHSYVTQTVPPEVAKVLQGFKRILNGYEEGVTVEFAAGEDGKLRIHQFTAVGGNGQSAGHNVLKHTLLAAMNASGQNVTVDDGGQVLPVGDYTTRGYELFHPQDVFTPEETSLMVGMLAKRHGYSVEGAPRDIVLEDDGKPNSEASDSGRAARSTREGSRTI